MVLAGEAAAILAAAELANSAFNASKAKKASKLKAKEAHHETYADLMNNALGRSHKEEGHRMSKNLKRAKSKSKSREDTVELVRGAFNI